MTTVETAPPTAPPTGPDTTRLGRSPSRRRPVVVGVALVVAAAVVGTGIWFLVYRQTYRPLVTGNADYTPLGAIRTITDGITDTQDVMVGPAGSQAMVSYPVTNAGDRPVTVLGQVGTGVTTLPAGVPEVQVRWSPFGSAGRPLPLTRRAALASSHAFPAHLGAHRQLLVWLIVTKPDCPSSSLFTVGQFTLRWQALGIRHSTTFALGQGTAPGVLPVLACYPAGSNLRFADD